MLCVLIEWENNILFCIYTVVILSNRNSAYKSHSLICGCNVMGFLISLCLCLRYLQVVTGFLFRMDRPRNEKCSVDVSLVKVIRTYWFMSKSTFISTVNQLNYHLHQTYPMRKLMEGEGVFDVHWESCQNRLKVGVRGYKINIKLILLIILWINHGEY